MFYVLLALRAELRARGVFDERTQPKLDALLPLVALGTVADVVKLDANNRRLVAQGAAAHPRRRDACGLARCSRWRGARPSGRPPSTSASRWARASTPRVGWPT
jgi:single-stranded-DNA-specific exonuclease